MLAAVPAVDVLLLAVTAVDLARGAEAGWSHGLAAVYLGFSVMLGPPLIRRTRPALRRRAARNRPTSGRCGCAWSAPRALSAAAARRC